MTLKQGGRDLPAAAQEPLTLRQAINQALG
jgi:hypothetical protein